MKGSVLGLLIAAGAFGASTIYLAVQLEAERDQAEQFAEQSRALAGRIADLERAQAELEALKSPGPTSAMAGPPAFAGKLGLADTALPAPPDSGKTEGLEPGALPAPPERSEALQKMMRAQLRANFRRVHADIGDKLGLSKEEANKLVDLMVEQTIALGDRGRQGGDRTPEQRGADLRAVQQKNLAEISALIGADKMAAYQDYQDSMPARQEVDMLSRQLEGNDAGALTKDQRDRLVSALAEERKRVPAPDMAAAVSREDFQKDMSSWQDDYNQRAATRASSILDGDQQKTYAEYQQWTREMRTQFETRRAAREAANAARAGGASAPPPR